MQPWLRICAATAFLLWPSLAGAQTQHDDCRVRCVTIHQFFEDEIFASIPLRCDRDGRICRGVGALRVRDDETLVNIAAEFRPASLMGRDPRSHQARTLSVYFHAPGVDVLSSDLASIRMLLGREASQKQDFKLHWRFVRQREEIPGQIRVIVNRYMPAPSPRVWPMPYGW